MPHRSNPAYGTPNWEMLGRWLHLEPPDDGPFWALNLMKYHSVAQYAHGTVSRSGREADDAYAPLGPLDAIGAAVAFHGDVLDQRPRRRFAAVAVGLALLCTACRSSSSASSTTSDPVTASTTPSTTTTAEPTTGTPVAGSMRAKRYCEVLLVRVVDGQANADVYNSYPLNSCPQEQWTRLDARAIAKAEGVTLAVLNGPRYWLMDRVEKQGGAATLPKKTFGGIAMYRQASLAIGPLADAAKPYLPHEVNRSTVFTFDAGHRVYELTTPDGPTYLMQTWSQQKDPELAEADLAGLGSRLHLPAGWTYRTRTLEAPLRVVTTTSPARVLQDDLGNSYSQETGP